MIAPNMIFGWVFWQLQWVKSQLKLEATWWDVLNFREIELLMIILVYCICLYVIYIVEGSVGWEGLKRVGTAKNMVRSWGDVWDRIGNVHFVFFLREEHRGEVGLGMGIGMGTLGGIGKLGHNTPNWHLVELDWRPISAYNSPYFTDLLAGSGVFCVRKHQHWWGVLAAVFEGLYMKLIANQDNCWVADTWWFTQKSLTVSTLDKRLRFLDFEFSLLALCSYSWFYSVLEDLYRWGLLHKPTGTNYKEVQLYGINLDTQVVIRGGGGGGYRNSGNWALLHTPGLAKDGGSAGCGVWPVNWLDWSAVGQGRPTVGWEQPATCFDRLLDWQGSVEGLHGLVGELIGTSAVCGQLYTKLCGKDQALFCSGWPTWYGEGAAVWDANGAVAHGLGNTGSLWEWAGSDTAAAMGCCTTRPQAWHYGWHMCGLGGRFGQISYEGLEEYGSFRWVDGFSHMDFCGDLHLEDEA
ncbi:hypothetical protein E3N88_37208 [Mikania micrantha]|uniref:Uncharacterized protein n=1 Tax=Mikania micrantha TaxID=192012 RepID=A0A5N6M6M7_9ASTR|nr:hypothetical protein E3N88_37208 [Mikania micrantha]